MAKRTIKLTENEMKSTGAYVRNTKLGKELIANTDSINHITLIKKDDGTGFWKIETGKPYALNSRPVPPVK